MSSYKATYKEANNNCAHLGGELATVNTTALSREVASTL